MINMHVEEYTVGDFATNCYFVVNRDAGEMVIIDPGCGNEYKRLIQKIKDSGIKPVAILLTHGHYDHTDNARKMADAFGIPIIAHEEERQTLENPALSLTRMFSNGQLYSADQYVKDEEILNLAGFTIRVLFTPGHTPGGCCYYFDGLKLLASGDTLFNQSVGRTDFPGGSMSNLVRGIREKLLKLPGDTEVLPGHMSRTTIGFERQYNPFL